jgi:hypothetical protein
MALAFLLGCAWRVEFRWLGARFHAASSETALALTRWEFTSGRRSALHRVHRQSLALLGRTRVSVSMLDALDVSVSLGAQHNREQTESPLSAQPLSVGLRVRLWPWFDRGGPDVALSLVQTIPSSWLGSR